MTILNMVWGGWWSQDVKNYLCFTANTAGSTVKLNKYWSPTAVTLEISTDWKNRNTYTIWNTITLSNVWDKVYFRNTSETDTNFSTSTKNYYYFGLTWSINASWDVGFLLNKNSTKIASAFCFSFLFLSCSALITAPEIPMTTINGYCFNRMFAGCSNLITLPRIYATNYANIYNVCSEMFSGCSKIKVSETQTGDYQNEYRLPPNWSWTIGYNTFYVMFYRTWWTFTWTPNINTTYYTSNVVL